MSEEARNPEQLKERARNELRSLGVEKIEMVGGKVIFHFTGPIYQEGPFQKLHVGSQTGDDFGRAGAWIDRFLKNGNTRFRCVDAGKGFRRVPEMLKRGIDIPNFDIEKISLLDVSPWLDHTTEYGGRNAPADGVFPEALRPGIMEHSKVVLIYDGAQVGSFSPKEEGEGYKNMFFVPPKDALLGLLLLYGEEDKPNGLVKFYV